MRPTWIINFSKKEPFGSFFDTYWEASLHNGKNLQTDRDKWFYCYDASADDASYEKLHQTARQLTADLSETQLRLIPGVVSNDELCVIAMGDITSETTIHRMHLWMTRLRQAFNERPWTSIPFVRYYALLWTPQTANIDPGLPQSSRGFLNELSTLENLDINHRPFEKVIFFESSVKEADKKNAFTSMEMAALQIALGNHFSDESMNSDKYVFLNGGAAGTFYEAQVQSDQEAYALSNLLLDKFCNSTDLNFVDDTEVMQYVDNQCEPMLNDLSADVIMGKMTANCPELTPKRYNNRPFSTSSAWGTDYKRVWQSFIVDEIGGFKARLVNDLGWELDFFESDYLRKVVVNQVEYINQKKEMLEKLVFDIYNKETRLKRVSIEQGRKVLERLRTRIKLISGKADDAVIQNFQLSPEEENAYDQAKSDHPQHTSKQVMEVLEAKLRTLPAFNLAMLARSLVLGFVLGYTGLTMFMHSLLTINYPWLPYAAMVLGAVLPFVVTLCMFFQQARRINALRMQFIACRKHDIKEHLQRFVTEQIRRTYDEYIIYLDWLERNKLNYLQRMLSAIHPATFTFNECSCFQPLLNYGMSMRSEDFSTEKPLIPVRHKERSADGEDEQKALSGSFDKDPLLLSSPANKVDVQGDSWSLFELMDPKNAEYCQKICQSLMDEVVTISSGKERTISFEGAKIGNTRLLLLDYSGSMVGEAIEDLKDAVRQLGDVSTVEWIAFNDKVVGKSFGLDCVELDDIEPDGGTCFVPAIQAAADYLQESYADQVVLISDGYPSESINELLKACELLNQPLHTVYIGSSASNVMEQLAKCTGGEQITVSSAKEIKDNVIEIFQHFLLAEGGRFTFAQMLRKCRIDGCAVALYNYAKRLTQSTHTRMGDIITHYGYGPGISEWFRVAQPSCHIRQSAPSSSTNNYLQLTVDAGSDTQQALDEKLREWRVPHKSVLSADTDIDMTAIVFSYGYVRLQDFLWACFEIDDKTINHKDELAALMQKDYPIINIYGKDIEKL